MNALSLLRKEEEGLEHRETEGKGGGWSVVRRSFVRRSLRQGAHVRGGVEKKC